MEDSDILALYFARDERAIEETQKKYGRYCRTVAYNVFANEADAEETVNDTYLGAWNSIPPQRPRIFSAFLAKITRNLALKKQRANMAARRGGEAELTLLELCECVPASSDVEKEMEARELSAVIDTFLRGLPETERRVFMRRYWYMDSIDDICLAHGFTEGKVKMLLSRTRKKLLERLVKEGVNL
ncbi:MAG: sigma-70 family RNA polymerase sigma factor [Clostridia bacterium]|nr:sigma-70 family RNA polymerase sigma factor [Clostridia bacterium]